MFATDRTLRGRDPLRTGRTGLRWKRPGSDRPRPEAAQAGTIWKFRLDVQKIVLNLTPPKNSSMQQQQQQPQSATTTRQQHINSKTSTPSKLESFPLRSSSRSTNPPPLQQLARLHGVFDGHRRSVTALQGLFDLLVAVSAETTVGPNATGPAVHGTKHVKLKPTWSCCCWYLPINVINWRAAGLPFQDFSKVRSKNIWTKQQSLSSFRMPSPTHRLRLSPASDFRRPTQRLSRRG